MLTTVTPESKRALAQSLKEEGNDLVKSGQKSEALKKYEKGIRILGVSNYELDEDGLKAFDSLDLDGRALLSILASNAAQMYMDPEVKQLARAIERCNLAVEVNPDNAKAYFRRAQAAHDHASNVAKGADTILAQAQKDVRKFLQIDEGNAAAKSLQERLARKRQALQGHIMREKVKEAPRVEPEWFEEVKSRSIFVCMCGTVATGRDQLNLPEALLSMALQAKDKKAISVGVAYVGYRSPDELEMFTEEWQKKYYRMLRLGERAVKVPEPRQLVIQGEVYNMWSLLEGRVRVLRVNEIKKNGEKVGAGWMRYCSQLLWHGEAFVFQSCRAYMRFAPGWDEQLKNDLSVAQRQTQQKVVLSWMSRGHEDEAWQWQSCEYGDQNTEPTGTLVAEGIDSEFGWIRFRKRFFSHSFGMPMQIAFYSPHSSFSSSEILASIPADPFLNALSFHGQLCCENVRLHTHGWDIFAPTANFTWETTHDANAVIASLSGGPEPMCWDKGPNPALFDEQKVRADACINPWENSLSALDDELLDLPVPTSCFWTTVLPKDLSPWNTGQQVGYKFRKGTRRTMIAYEKQTGVDFYKVTISERARNAGFNGDRDFEDCKMYAMRREAEMSKQLGPDSLKMYRSSFRQ